MDNKQIAHDITVAVLPSIIDDKGIDPTDFEQIAAEYQKALDGISNALQPSSDTPVVQF